MTRVTWEELKSKIEVNSICELKTKYKDFKSKIIGLDFNGFDAILPLNEISNNPELSLALFNTIKKGEVITLVLLKIDEENKKIIFSSKIFRNKLDDILSFTKCKSIVESNRNSHLRIDSKFLRQHRNILDRLRGDLSSNELTFLYELIQNSVDHPNRNFDNNVSINFEVLDNYLLVKHNGALFTENNFESITGILYGEQIEEGDRNRIGYKGIGFKSVFRFTNKAYIRSGNFSFRFSKEESGSDKPWEVLPLFQIEKDMVAQIPQFDFFNSPVAFAFEFNSEQNRNYVIKYLNQLSQNPYLLIFLDNLTQLKIKAPRVDYFDNGTNQSLSQLDVNFVKKKIKTKEIDSINLLINDNTHSEWLIYTKNDLVITDEEVIKELMDESVTAVPSKMRNFRIPRITIALPKHTMNDDVINLFTYLPLSNTKYKLPFLVNADFIPDLDRTDIIHNLKYNNHVLKFVALTLEELSQKLASNNQLEYLNTLIPDLDLEYQSSANTIVKSLTDYLSNTKIMFNNQQIPFSNIVIDKTGFSSSLGLEIFKELIDNENIPLNLIAEYKKICKLIERINPNNVFDIYKLKEKISSECFKEWLKNPSNNFEFINYLYNSQNTEITSLLVTEKVILSESCQLFRADEIFTSIPHLVSFITDDKVNSILRKLIDNSSVVLQTIDFHPINFLILYKETINTHLTNKMNIVNFWNFIYDNWDELKENYEVKKILKSKYTLCKPIIIEELIIKEVSSVYLCKEIAEDNEVESIIESLKLQDKAFIDPIFLTSSQRNSPKIWREIFFGAKQGLLDLIGELIKQLGEIDDSLHFQAANEIFKYWSKNKNERKLTSEQFSLLKKHLRIKCIDTIYRNASECIISDYFNNNTLLNKWLPDIQLLNQVAQEYAPNTNQISEWKLFLVAIGCVELLDKQDIFVAKVKCFIDTSESMRSSHFEIMKSLSDLYKSKNENGLKFKMDAFKFQLKTKGEDWILASNIYFSDIYNPKITLENDDTVNTKLSFLNNSYHLNGIDKYFLLEIGVNDNFKITSSEIRRHELPTDYRDSIDLEEDYIPQNAILYSDQHKIKNHVDLNFKDLLLYYKYAVIFWGQVLNNNLNYLFQETKYTTFYKSFTFDNYLLSYIKQNLTFPSQNGTLKKPSDLYSYKLTRYIDNLDELPMYDFTEIFYNNDRKKSLEDMIGIKSHLSLEHTVNLLKRNDDRLTLDDVKALQIVAILSEYQPNQEEIEDVFLLNEDGDWKRPNELVVNLDDELSISSSQKLNRELLSLAKNFNVNELSESNLVVITDPEILQESVDIINFFKNYGKYIAFKLDCDNYEILNSEFQEKINNVTFYEVNSILKIFPEVNPIFTLEFEYLLEESDSKLIYQGNWKTNETVKKLILSKILGINIPYGWFDNLILRWNENEIIEKLVDDFGDKVPFSLNDDLQDSSTKNVGNINEATLGSTFSNDISSDSQIEANREAREIIKEKLEKDGFEFTKGIGEFSTIDGVMKDNAEFPLVVKSYKDQSKPLKIGANEWTQLMQPNSVFCLYFGDGKIGYMELGKLLRSNDDITISFSTENIEIEDRLEKFAELLEYFEDVHFNFHNIIYSNVANDFKHFGERGTELDLSGDDDSLL